MNEDFERRQFETWVQAGNQTGLDLVRKFDTGHYYYQATHTAWQAWKGRAELVKMEEGDAETPQALAEAKEMLQYTYDDLCDTETAHLLSRQLLRAHERIGKLKDALRGSIDPKAPLEELRGTFPLVIYMGSESDRDEFMGIMQLIKPGMVQRKL